MAGRTEKREPHLVPDPDGSGNNLSGRSLVASSGDDGSGAYGNQVLEGKDFGNGSDAGAGVPGIGVGCV